MTPTLDSLTSPAIIKFVSDHMAEMLEYSPPDSCHALPIEDLRTSNTKFWTIYEGDTPRACGALKQLDAARGEIKSMRVDPTVRGKGLGQTILETILEYAQEAGLKHLLLETGSQPQFVAARAMYVKNGFRECPPFDDYVLDPNSVFFEKTL